MSVNVLCCFVYCGDKKSIMEYEALHLFILANLCALITGAPTLCSTKNLDISMGRFSLSNGFSEGSVLRYTCPEGYYPSVKSRQCKNGRWDPKLTRKPQCKMVTCPDPRGFENGDVYPHQQRYFVNSTTTYSCYSGYTFSGSVSRICQPNGKWSGGTPICGRNSDHCPDPGFPPGTTRSGNMFNIDDKVTYNCHRELTLIGSRERVCQKGGLWTGSEPECYADFTYDTPEEASEGFRSSLKAMLQVSQQYKEIGGKLDIYIAFDVSDIIDENEFKKAKGVISKLIEKISYYEVSPNYEILIFATDVTRIVSMQKFKIGQKHNLLQFLNKLGDYKYSSKRTGKGTNISKAYFNIYKSMLIEKEIDKKSFLQTQHIVILFSDGQANMGGDPKPKVDQIKDLVIQKDPSREEKLDLYVFGMGDDVNAEDINHLKTDRGNEKFFFKLRDLHDLKKTFDTMTDEGTSVQLCGLYKDYSDGSDSHKRRQYPWLAKIFVIRSDGTISKCMGSLVTSTFILTAAHCFKSDDTPDRITVDMESKSKGINVKEYIPHPRYNLTAKRHKGIPEYYEFDIALLQLEEPLIMSPDIQPICIPCTRETSGALKLSDREGTCKKHEEMLLSAETVNAAFMSNIGVKIEQKDITIKQGNWWDACIEDAKKAKGIIATNAKDIVSRNFLCSGGIKPTTDYVACKGDSGGATFVPGARIVQVGIVSWGVKNMCARSPKPKSEKDSRDYHTNLFSPEIRSFLKKYLGNERIGTPLTFL
ncbi:complement factor B-like isoform X1 [Paramisgurnus dabryanus]|uniref:complement factor B-like isoform X1 n=1 Tax=Paramisgurnus dabryanus TaxID=90735 RepID=UPI0031F434C6